MRRSISPELCAIVSAECAAGVQVEAIAANHHITTYVADLIRANHPTPTEQAPTDPPDVAVPDTETLDPSDLGHIRRRLAAGRNVREVAKELGISWNVVDRIRQRAELLHRLAAGQPLPEAAAALGLSVPAAQRLKDREPRFGPKWKLRKGERYAITKTRCPVCNAMLTVLPCRTCRIRAMIAAGERVWLDKSPPPGIAWSIFAVNGPPLRSGA